MQKLDSVQGLRGIAAGLVVLAHGALWAGEFGSLGLTPRAYEMLGAAGVMMFFVISGFIMVHTNADNQHGASASRRFVTRRIIRIVPLYWIMTLVALALAMKNSQPVSDSHLVKSLLFIPHGDGSIPMRPLLGVGWTLNYEMFFYALFAITLLLFRKIHMLLVILAVLIVIGQIINPLWRYEDPGNALAAWTDPIMLLFAAGLCLALYRRDTPFAGMRRPLIWTAAGLTVILLLQDLLVSPGSYPPWWRIGVMLLCAAIAAVSIFAAEGAWTPAWLILLGDASYSTYLVHPMLFGFVRRFGGEALLPIHPALAMMFFVAVSTAAGIAVHKIIEKPVTKWLSRQLNPPRFVGAEPAE